MVSCLRRISVQHGMESEDIEVGLKIMICIF